MKRRLAGALVVALIAVAWLRGCGGPEDRAASLVPADALLYVHASAAEVRELTERFAVLAPVRGRLEEPWLGDEVAYARLPDGELTLLSVDDEDAARDYAEGVGGAVRDGFVVVGEPAGEEEEALADLDAYRAAAEDLREDRVAHAWVRGELAARAPVPIGAHDVIADLVVTGEGADVRARRFGGAAEAGDFAPELLDAAPRDAFAYLGVRGLASLAPLLPDATGVAAPEVAAAIGPLVEALDGEIALTAGDTAVTLLARPDDPAAARSVLAGLQGVIARALTGTGEATGQVGVFVERDLGDGLTGFALTLAGGGELVYAVDGGRVAVSNSEDGVRRGLRGEDSLRDAEAFAQAVTGVPETAQALAFAATDQLLELADAVGLDAGAAYRAARPDLAGIDALGAVVRRQGDDTTVELNLLFP